MKKKFLGRLLTMLLVAAMVFTLLPASAIAAAEWWGGDDGVAVQSNNSQPFANDSGVHYRIPAIVTLDDGTLVAAADKRNHIWQQNQYDDCCNIDTIVAIANDKTGSNWTSTVVNDTGYTGSTIQNSGTYIDPALATDSSTVYMLVDLFPGQTVRANCTGQSKASTGLNSNGDLKLRNVGNNESDYNYYLKDGSIYSNNGTKQAAYTVNANFDLLDSESGEKLCNLFDINSYFMPEMTSYLVFRKSTDGGNTWSAPVILNKQVKTSSDTYFIDSPGRGVAIPSATGGESTIVFPCYSNSGRSCLIFSTDGGKNWTRTANVNCTSSEGDLVQLADGTLRFFMRHYDGSYYLKYADAVWNENSKTYEWQTPVTVSEAPSHNNTDIGALAYSKTSGGKQVILVSAPGTTSGDYNRNYGRIFVFTVGDNNTLELKNTYHVNESAFGYSCMTELNDGSIGLLYENGDDGGITYVKLDASDVTGLAFDNSGSGEDTLPETKTDPITGVTATVPAGSTMSVTPVTEVSGVTGNFVAYDLKVNNGEYTSATVVSIPVTGLDTSKTLYGFVVNSDGSITKVNGTLENGMYTFTAPHLSVVGVAEYADTEVTKTEPVTLTVGRTSTTYTVDGQYGYFNGTTVGGAKITANETPIEGKAVYTKAAFDSEATSATYYVSAESDAANVTDANAVEITIERQNGSYYIKNNDKYIYPNASYSFGWSYTSGSSDYATTTSAVGIGFDDDANSNRIDVSRKVSQSWLWSTVSTTCYLTLNNTATFGSSNNATSLYLYTRGTTNPTYKTDITFTGETVGSGSIQIGSTLFNVTVNKAQKSVTVQTGKEITFDDASTTKPSNSNPAAADVKLENGKLTITGKTATTEPFTIETETTIYTVTVVEVPTSTSDNILVSASTVNSVIAAGDPVTGLVLSYDDGTYTNGTTSFKVASKTGTVKTWVSSDESVATVSDDGTITGAGVGNCYVYAYYDDNTYTVIPVRVVTGDTSTTYDRVFTIYSDALYHSKLYCAVVSGEDRDTDWTELPTGYVIYANLDCTYNSGIIFAAKPDDGYALTYMGHSTDGTSAASGEFNYIGRNGDSYASGSKYTDGTYYFYDYAESGYKTDGTYVGPLFSDNALTGNQQGIYPTDDFKTLLKNAVELDLDAAFHYTRQGSAYGNVSWQFQVVSDKLPTMTKKIKSVTHNGETTDYTEGMGIEQGDTITYEIAITTYKTHQSTYTAVSGSTNYGTISYPSAALTDELVGMNKEAVTLPTSPTTGLPSITDGGKDVEAETVTKSVSFTLSLENFSKVVEGVLTNEANLEYTYNAQYSKGTAQASAEASAQCKIKVPVYIVDFGVPVTLIGRDSVLGNYQITSGKSVNGAEIAPANDGKGIVYTPGDETKTFGAEADYVTLSLNNGQYSYGIRVIPASNVLYEENFLTPSVVGTWNKTENGINNQQEQKVNDTDKYVFGYDKEAYGDKTGESGVWKIDNLTPGASYPYLSTTFYGNAFDLIGNCSPTTGRVMLLITNEKGVGVKAAIIDTRYNDAGDDGINQVPLAHLELGEDATYIARIYASGLAATATQTAVMRAPSAYSNDSFASVLAECGLSMADVEYIDMSAASVATVSSIATYADTASTIVRKAGTHVEIDSFRVYRSTTDDVAMNYPENEQNVKYVNILNAATSFTAFIEGSDSDEQWYDANLYELKGGPQNEIYLRPTEAGDGSAIAFKVPGDTILQISARVVENDKNATLTINGSSYDINSNTEMYYEVKVPADGIVTIKNTGSGMLALGNLKVKDGTTVQALSEEDYPAAIALLNETVTPTEPEQPTFDPQINVTVRSIPVFRNKLVTLTITTSTDVAQLTVNGRVLRPTNSWLVKMGWSDTYTYVMTDTVKKGESKDYTIIATNADGADSTRIVKAN